MSENPPNEEQLRAIEAIIFASEEPLTPRQIGEYLGQDCDIQAGLVTLAEHYQGRGVELVVAGGRWHFQTASDMAHMLRKEREAARKLSRAATETLAIIAYHEPVSRAEIESIRGVQTSKGTLDVLMETDWIRPAGRRETPGRPLLYATTKDFLTHFGLKTRRDLPGIADLRAAGLLDPVESAFDEAMGQQTDNEEQAQGDGDPARQSQIAHEAGEGEDISSPTDAPVNVPVQGDDDNKVAIVPKSP